MDNSLPNTWNSTPLFVYSIPLNVTSTFNRLDSDACMPFSLTTLLTIFGLSHRSVLFDVTTAGVMYVRTWSPSVENRHAVSPGTTLERKPTPRTVSSRDMPYSPICGDKDSICGVG